ncbi:MAG: HypC/HybG/HupF family hydrogenase formation chaperone [Clostridium cochlearium]|uniref:HypC/HybG/HupF family hydrogenase formation chaperone n=1 Tax=Clostridium cochlearium TaxID=1494 RepID=UPI00280B55F6|nr:HypC/HybG/HupF family hydrogenase formation chaperone [Clostridium cochlearium]MDU1441934.1 HypC/HybG/HupF family hydrogenase formation chaperone [Clostridium cochlearium]
MCIAVPAKVEEIFENQAKVNFKGVKTKVNICLLEKVDIGDYILIHAGCAIEKINEKQAKETLKLFEEILSYE